MNGKAQAMQEIEEFFKSEEKGILVTGTHQFKKHIIAMAMIEKCYKNAHVLFRINGLQNITGNSFLGCVGVEKQPKAGEQIRIGHNYYEFDSLFNRGTWSKTSDQFDFAICYPIDALARKKDNEPIENLCRWKRIEKIFLCSWTDGDEYDYPFFSEYYDRHVIYDAEEDDPAYHKRVLGK
ncbi:hypothetical protein OBV_09130 [Oscillibacter valericigenes Sjm18-20]|nr:hypothetical protein OBV_09130 [Oscillibacter valericigenes Sjm18-20]